MREIAAGLLGWFEGGTAFGLATVVATSGSSMREIGAVLAVGPDGAVVGGVSGGCVEGAVYEAAAAAARDGRRERLRFGVAGDDPFAVGLTCGGEIDVVVDRVDSTARPYFGKLLARLVGRAAVCEVTVVAGAAVGHLVVTPEDSSGTLGFPALDADARAVGREMLAAAVSGLREIRVDGRVIEVFVRSFPAPPLMIVFGAIDLADSVAQAASFVGYRTVVCDARPVFATPQRFPNADEVVTAWPHDYLTQQWQAGLIDSSTALCVLTHDAKFDGPLLEVAVRTPATYIGVLGSRRTHDDRTRRLSERGLETEALTRLSSPVGLDLGGRSPQETALSIVAEVVAVANGRDGGRLRDGDGAIHSHHGFRRQAASSRARL